MMKRKHPVLDCPILGPILLFIYGDLSYQVPGVILYMCTPEKFLYFEMAVVGLLIMGLHCLWFKGDFRGGFCRQNFMEKREWSILLSVIILDSLVCIFDMVTGTFAGLTLEGFSSSLMAGICEEVGARYILISVMMRRYKDKGAYLPALLFSALTFGLSHYTNLLNDGSTFSFVTLQVVVTVCSGLAMGAIFIRTGNIIYAMGWHFLHDFLCSLTESVETVETGTYIECGIVCVIYVALAFSLLKGNKEKISAIWKQQWT